MFMQWLSLISATLVTATSGGCNITLPTDVSLTSHAPVRIAYRDWLSAQLTAHVLRHTLEMGGHRVELVNMGTRPSTKIWTCDVSHSSCTDYEHRFKVDVDPENWHLKSDYEKYASMVLVSNPSIFDAGSIGYDGQSGMFYAPGSLRTEHPGLKLYEPEAHSQGPTILFMFSSARLPNSGESEIDWSDYPAWKQYGHVDEAARRWVPPHCDRSNTMCADMYHNTPAWDMGLIESLVFTYRMPYNVRYLGDATKVIRHHLNATRPAPILFYHWTPDALLMSIAPEKIVFPAYTPGCVEKEGSIGNRNCEASVVTLAKAASSHLRWNVPSAYVATTRFALSLSELNSMMKLHYEGGGTFELVEDVACHFVQSNRDHLLRWAKGCDPGSKLDVNDLTCSKENSVKDVPDDALGPCSTEQEACGTCRMCIMCALFVVALRVTTAW
eukprot:gnl/MRDRNA2_/MRDRNA2_68389_c0_seq1.p1 gnl/MRDRNA2_/MRDRNA2_68389_c0~~gnl/MRDRNA2_/MRDRNA2_68389_c0_seq1.p1  ORF type:complete len:441 (+),score=40.19 gnl/MRDRNA2_/MRDRNA2_68389_c0_seq1:104-1426(+)